MVFDRIQNRILLLFVGLVSAIVLVSGGLLDWAVRRSLEAELGRKLIALAQAVSASLEPEEIAVIRETTGPRAERRLGEKIRRFKNGTDAARIFLFDPDKRILLDTHSDDAAPPSAVGLLFFESELQSVRNGDPAHSILFRGEDGRPAMTGFSPLFADGEVIGGVAVEGSAAFLAAADAIRNRLVWIAALSVFAAVVLGLLLARTITRPVGRLLAASERIGRGDYTEPIPRLGRDEIGNLTRTMEAMRLSILERENELKAMVAGVAHEIRNPLGGMELFAGLLQDRVKEESSAAGPVDHIVREIGHLKEIVNRFLDFARPRLPVPESCNVREAVDSCLRLLLPAHPARPVTLNCRIGPADAVRCDPNHLREILMNLLKNALEAMPGGGTLVITSRPAGPFIRIRIGDSGRGIPDPVRPQIFTPFFTTRPEGTGLGLSIAKSLAEANGGRLLLAASGPDGTVFEMDLPPSGEANPAPQRNGGRREGR